VSDVSDEMQLVAMNPAEMREAQTRLAEWFRAKLDIVRADEKEMQECLETAAKAGWKLRPFERQANNALARVQYYEKCLAAVEAGYAIVPNFPVDVIAIRTTRKRPKPGISEWSWSTFRCSSNSPPIGEGRNVSVDPVIYSREYPAQGEAKAFTQYFPKEFQEIEFPISLAQPIVMDATCRALAAKVFDEIGVLPANRKADPLVIGRIYHPTTKNPLAFLVAWWIDTRTL
jgi:hypothetical protein